MADEDGFRMVKLLLGLGPGAKGGSGLSWVDLLRNHTARRPYRYGAGQAGVVAYGYGSGNGGPAEAVEMGGEGFGEGYAVSQAVEVEAPQQGIVVAHPDFTCVALHVALQSDLFVSFNGFESGVSAHADNGPGCTVHFGPRQGRNEGRAAKAGQYGHDAQDHERLKEREALRHCVFSMSVLRHQTMADMVLLPMPIPAWDGEGIAVIRTSTPQMLCVCVCGSSMMAPRSLK